MPHAPCPMPHAPCPMPHASNHTVFLVDDDPAVRESMSILLRAAGYPVELHADAEAFLSACGPERHGCLISDLHMPGMDGLQLQEEMARRGIRLPVVFLTGHGDIPASVRAIRGGAVDFLTKPVAGATLLNSIAAAMTLAGQWATQGEHAAEAARKLGRLTKRERDVMKGIIAGQTNKEIGRQIGISHRTVEIHKAHLMEKTEVSSWLELAHLARRAGFDES